MRYLDYNVIYTDASYDRKLSEASVAIFVEERDYNSGTHLQFGTSVLTPELYAIFKAVLYAEMHSLKKALIVSDSLSTLSIISNCLKFKNIPETTYKILIYIPLQTLP